MTKNIFKISVIIPVYNVEKYIDNCLLSIVKQTIGIKNIEVIVVNDSTPDNSMNIVQKYQDKYPNNFVIINNDKNKGPGFSRNVAMKRVNSKFISFVDGDDWLDANVFEYGIDKIKENNVDVFLYQMKCFSEKDGGTFTKNITDDNYKKEDYIIKKESIVGYPQLVFETSACNKIYKKESLNEGVLFTEGHKFEDMFFCIKNLLDIDLYVTSKVRYNYRKREDESSTIDLAYKYEIHYYDQLNELFLVKNITNQYPALKCIIEWFTVYSWSAFLHNTLLNVESLDYHVREDLFKKTKKLWEDIDGGDMYNDYIEVHHKALLKIVDKYDTVKDASNFYKKRIFLYKLHAKFIKLVS